MPMFSKINDRTVELIGKKKENLFPSLDSRMYTCSIEDTMKGIAYNISPMSRYDNSKVIKAGVFKEAYDYMTEYFDPIKIGLRKEMGMMEKMNIMLKGDPGTGKTHLACTIASEIVRKNNGIGLVISNFENANFPDMIDRIRINDGDDRLIVMVLDEMEKNPGWKLRSASFLSFLDGADSRKNVILISTVNEVDDLPSYLTSRPGRFEKIYNFEFKTKEVMTIIAKGLMPDRYKEEDVIIENIVDRAIASDLGTIDHLRFMILDYLFNKEKGVELTPIPVKEVKKEEEDDEEDSVEVGSIDFELPSSKKVLSSEDVIEKLRGLAKAYVETSRN